MMSNLKSMIRAVTLEIFHIHPAVALISRNIDNFQSLLQARNKQSV
jgi:hypothetical protein